MVALPGREYNFEKIQKKVKNSEPKFVKHGEFPNARSRIFWEKFSKYPENLKILTKASKES